jgi:signal transduction histidine kinase
MGMMRSLRLNEESAADTNLSMQLLYVNICVLVVGGFISYYLARRSLIPIEKSHEAQSRFTSDASHELRTPLAVMKTELEVALKDKNATVDGLKDILKSNLEEVDKLSKLSEMLLSISRIDNSDLKLGPINLTKITKETIKQFGKPADRIKLDSKKQQTAWGNEVALADVIKILIDNALIYSPNDSEINIKIAGDSHNVTFQISNTGPGIDPDKLPHIFDRFYRADSSRTSGEHKGYGLGLALAKNITQLHQGQLNAFSKPNDMTTFTLVLHKKLPT